MVLMLECYGYSSSQGQGRFDKRMTVKISGPGRRFTASHELLLLGSFGDLNEP